jgi:hypothetical protein
VAELEKNSGGGQRPIEFESGKKIEFVNCFGSLSFEVRCNVALFFYPFSVQFSNSSTINKPLILNLINSQYKNWINLQLKQKGNSQLDYRNLQLKLKELD